MIDFKKINIQTKMEMILIWLEQLASKEYLSSIDKDIISDVAEYLYKEALK